MRLAPSFPPSVACAARPADAQHGSELPAKAPTIDGTNNLSDSEASCRMTAHSQRFTVTRAARGAFIGGATDGGTCVISCRRSVDEEGKGRLAYKADFCEGLEFDGKDFDDFAQGLQTVFDDASSFIERAMNDGASDFDVKYPKAKGPMDPNWIAAKKVATVLDAQYKNRLFTNRTEASHSLRSFQRL